jgi:hypothetical protein
VKKTVFRTNFGKRGSAEAAHNPAPADYESFVAIPLSKLN